MSEEELRQEAVRRRRLGENAEEIAAALGRTSRWVRKWVARADDEATNATWAQGHSRAPVHSPSRTPDAVRQLIIDARRRLEANPRGQYGALAVAWQLRCMGVDPVPGRWTIERVIADAGLAKARRRPSGYVSKAVPYPARLAPEPGTTHQVDMVGPRHLDGGVAFNVLNLIDIGSHSADSEILLAPRPNLVAAALVAMWGRVGVPRVAQMDNASNFRGAIPPAWQYFGPVVAACLDLDVTARFIPVREPWRNGVIEHFNDVWDKSFFRTERFAGIDHLQVENRAFVAFHNAEHRYSAHGGRSPDEICDGRLRYLPVADYRVPTVLPARGRIEVVRYVRSNRIVDLFGKRIILDADHAHQYVTAIIKVRSKTLQVITVHGEIVHEGAFNLARTLR